jgi:hypothetical protein
MQGIGQGILKGLGEFRKADKKSAVILTFKKILFL